MLEKMERDYLELHSKTNKAQVIWQRLRKLLRQLGLYRRLSVLFYM